jgi:alpha-L-rhamnosidase
MNKLVCFNITKRISQLLLVLLIFAAACNPKDAVKISDLSVEYRINPLGVDTPEPRFSWKIRASERAVYQSAYQIIVGETPGEVKRGSGKLWDTGKLHGDLTVNLAYAGDALQSNTKYFWRVRVWLDDENSVWSEPAFFHTGILETSEWKAQWITAQEEITDASPLLRKEFQVEKKVDQAIAYVTACGFYEFFLNGQKVGDHVLDPGVTDYRETILYSTYDVTSLLKKGANAAGAMLGNGAYNLLKTKGRWSWGSGGASLGNPCFLMQLMITYSDGSQAMITSDNTWKYAPGPVTFNNLYGGEDYDARKEVPGWSSSGFNDAEWQQVAIAAEPGGSLRSQLMPAIKVTNTIQPVKMTNPTPGVYLFDLGQNIAGWWRLEVKGSPGQVIRIRGDETLNNLLFPKPLEDGDSISTNTRYHPFIWTEYTIKGNSVETYEPRFFYSGFRYIELTTSDRRNPAQLKVEGRVVRSALDRNGTFESSDSLLNQIHRAGLWSQMGNTQSYPTDCPHREKGAYNGDGQVIAETSMHDFHMAPFYTKWINDMRDSQEENGRIPNTSPVLVGGMGGGVAWGSAYILIPWWMHNYYQDSRILKDHYPAMKEYLLYLKELGTQDQDPSEPYIIDNFLTYWYSLGEWCAPGQKDCPNHPVVNTFYYYYNSHLLSKIAGVLGYPEDAQYFQSLSDTIREAFNRKFFNPETSLYGTDETYQTYQLLALIGDMVPEGHREGVFQTIVDDIERRGDHLNTGIIGTKYLWQVLVQGGQNELAYRVATQTTYPSFGYWIKNGSTTLLEEWSGANSHNHQMFGSITEYFYKYLAGIQSPMEGNTSGGYKHIYIEPHVPEKLEFVNATLETVAGRVSSSWKKEADAFIHNVSIPANTSGTIALPILGPGAVTVWEGDSKVWDENGFVEGFPCISAAHKEAGRIIFQIRSGEYKFRVKRD